MRTDALIEALARDARPVPPHALDRRLAVSVGAGAAAALVSGLAVLGTRPDLAAATSSAAFWLKIGTVAALGAAALMLVRQLARPDSHRVRGLWLVTAPIAALGLVAAIELAVTAAPDRGALVTAPPWRCVPLILLLAVPVFAALVHTLRRMAPTRPRAAGAAAGLAAAALAATVYCLSCSELSPVYVLSRYSVALALAALAGALVGPRLLRW